MPGTMTLSKLPLYRPKVGEFVTVGGHGGATIAGLPAQAGANSLYLVRFAGPAGEQFIRGDEILIDVEVVAAAGALPPPRHMATAAPALPSESPLQPATRPPAASPSMDAGTFARQLAANRIGQMALAHTSPPNAAAAAPAAAKALPVKRPAVHPQQAWGQADKPRQVQRTAALADAQELAAQICKVAAEAKANGRPISPVEALAIVQARNKAKT